jgi:hypothetical protein
MLQHQLSKMEIDFALEPERWKSYSASALDRTVHLFEHIDIVIVE